MEFRLLRLALLTLGIFGTTCVAAGLAQLAYADASVCNQEVRREIDDEDGHRWLFSACPVETVCEDPYVCEIHSDQGFDYCVCPVLETGQCKQGFNGDGHSIKKGGVWYPRGSSKCVNYNCPSQPSTGCEASWQLTGTGYERLVCPCP